MKERGIFPKGNKRGILMPTTTTKWNKENVAILEAAYNGDNSKLPEIARTLKTTVASVRSKLVNLKVYVAAVKPATTSKAKASKAEMVKAAEILLSVPSGSLVSFEKATVKDLKTFTDAIIARSEQVNVELDAKV